jgi:putative ABC transport system substrate-binding protein
MRRREFIAGLGGAAASSLAARAQQSVGLRRVGMLMMGNENDSELERSRSALMRGLADLGWTDGGNLRMDSRWSGGNVDRARMFAKELVGLQPHVLVAGTTPATAALQLETRTIPIVFAGISDPVGAAFVASLSRPGGNLTGFVNMEAAMSGKWLELLTEIAPGVNRVAAMFNPNTAPARGSFYLPSFEAAARLLKVASIAAPVNSESEIEAVVRGLGKERGSGLVVMQDAFTVLHRAATIQLAARNNVPTVYPFSYFVRDGGLLSYGADQPDIMRRAATYVDRIFRGAKPVDLPVQLPIKFEMALNAKTAKALGLTVPQSILLRADEVIE